MRKRNCDKWFDNVFWYTLYLLPLILIAFMLSVRADAYWLSFENDGIWGSAVFGDVWNKVFGTLLNINGNPVYDALNYTFGKLGVVPLFNEMGDNGEIYFLQVATWFVSIYMVHLCVDFILFIPRLAHKWLKKGYQED